MPSFSNSRSISDSIHKNSGKLNIIFTFKFTAQWQITSSSSSFCSWKLNNLSRNELFFALSQQETFPLHQLCKIWVYILRSALSKCSLISESFPRAFHPLHSSFPPFPLSQHPCSLRRVLTASAVYFSAHRLEALSVWSRIFTRPVGKNRSSRSEFSSQVSQDL